MTQHVKQYKHHYAVTFLIVSLAFLCTAGYFTLNPHFEGSWHLSAAPVDTDGDTIFDDVDNCIYDQNPGQEDDDGDDVGNVCDNCDSIYNPNQYDFDDEGTGDVCQLMTVYKEEEMQIAIGEDPYAPETPKETVILSGNVVLNNDVSQGDEDMDNLVETYTTGATETVLTGNSSLGVITLTITESDFAYEEKFEGLGFPADAMFSKEISMTVDGAPAFLSFGMGEPLPALQYKEEEGVIKRFPPLWGDPLCWFGAESEDNPFHEVSEMPILVWDDVEPIFWITLNCDQFWWDEYYGGQATPPAPETRLLPTDPFLYADDDAIDTKMEITLQIGEDPSDTLVLEGITEISGVPGDPG
ncbi:hypothetical protein KKF04_04650, partial [Patescibacteria group bacterium]|nr:hypothetical protein [Patescibacteria group bacterium]